MNNCIPVKFHKMSRNMDSLSIFLKSIKFNPTTMLFFSKNCYEFLKNNSTILGKTLHPFYSKNFVKYNENKNIRDYFSLISLYSGEWIYLQKLSAPNMFFNYTLDLPKEIILVYFEDEFSPKNVQVKLIKATNHECPVNCIFDNPSQFENSLIILSKENFEKLRRTTNIVSLYEGVFRLFWQCDDNYPGGIITLKTFDEKYHYLVESMEFPFFTKTFSITGLPNAIFFII